MSVKIEIVIPDNEVDGTDFAMRQRLAVLGFVSRAALLEEQQAAQEEAKKRHFELMAEMQNKADTYASHDVLSRAAEAPVEAKEEPKPEPAKKARAKKADPLAEPAKAGLTEEVVVTKGVGGPGVLNISAAPEHRVDPEVEAQDAADEAAEVATQPVKELTAEDLRAVMGQYVTAFGLAEAQADGPKLFADALGTPPAGSEMWSVTLASKNQDTLAKAIVAWNAAVEKGVRYGH